MPRLDPIEHKKRKDATRQHYIDKDGKPLKPESKSVAVQDKRDICDINKIVARYDKTKSIDPTLIRPEGRFGDFTKATDFQEAQNRVIRMNNEFMALPAEVRAKFENDPAKLVAFLSDPKNREESIKLGLRPRPKIETKKLETPDGDFWVSTKDGVEFDRVKIKTSAPAPGA